MIQQEIPREPARGQYVNIGQLVNSVFPIFRHEDLVDRMSSYFDEHDCTPLADGAAPDELLQFARYNKLFRVITKY